jgi:DNA-binding FadR family transcriptional regulator
LFREWSGTDFPKPKPRLEHDLPFHLALRRKAMESVSTKAFKAKFKWLTHSVFVYNRKNYDLPDVKVSNLPKP